MFTVSVTAWRAAEEIAKEASDTLAARFIASRNAGLLLGPWIESSEHDAAIAMSKLPQQRNPRQLDCDERIFAKQLLPQVPLPPRAASTLAFFDVSRLGQRPWRHA